MIARRGVSGMSDNGRDDFWNIERLVPPRAHRHKTVRYDVSGAEITVPADDDSVRGSDADREGRRLTSLSAEREREELVCEYSPDNSFVRRVQVYARQGGFHYYEDFERTMHKYLRLTVKHAEREPFFSYVPQYSQLSGARMSWYLYWRSACRRREYLPTDYSYVLLYVYELLNFHNLRHPDIMADELCSLWAAYRAEYPQLARAVEGGVFYTEHAAGARGTERSRIRIPAYDRARILLAYIAKARRVARYGICRRGYYMGIEERSDLMRIILALSVIIPRRAQYHRASIGIVPCSLAPRKNSRIDTCGISSSIKSATVEYGNAVL